MSYLCYLSKYLYIHPSSMPLILYTLHLLKQELLFKKLHRSFANWGWVSSKHFFYWELRERGKSFSRDVLTAAVTGWWVWYNMPLQHEHNLVNGLRWSVFQLRWQIGTTDQAHRPRHKVEMMMTSVVRCCGETQCFPVEESGYSVRPGG